MEPPSARHAIVADGGELIPDGTVYVVRPGDTLWDIADRLTGEAGDPRVAVDMLAEANGLDDGVIQPGDRLGVP
jgi:LysM repeat protein